MPSVHHRTLYIKVFFPASSFLHTNAHFKWNEDSKKEKALNPMDAFYYPTHKNNTNSWKLFIVSHLSSIHMEEVLKYMVGSAATTTAVKHYNM